MGIEEERRIEEQRRMEEKRLAEEQQRIEEAKLREKEEQIRIEYERQRFQNPRGTGTRSYDSQRGHDFLRQQQDLMQGYDSHRQDYQNFGPRDIASQLFGSTKDQNSNQDKNNFDTFGKPTSNKSYTKSM